MNKLNLLLGATAMLSMSAMVANAAFESETTEVDVKAEIIHARVLDSTPLNFGRIVIEADTQVLTTAIMSNGARDLKGNNAYFLDEPQKGVVTGANCSQLDWSTDLNEDGHLDLDPPSGVTMQESYIHLDCADNDDGNATFFGNMKLKNTSGIPAGEYTGSFTVTAIYPIATSEPEESEGE